VSFAEETSEEGKTDYNFEGNAQREKIESERQGVRLMKKLDLIAAHRPQALNALGAVPGRILVKYKNGRGTASERAALTAKYRLTPEKYIPLTNLYVYRMGATKERGKTLRALKREANIQYAEPDYILRINSAPNDSAFNSLWGLNNSGQTGGTADADIDAAEAWDYGTGSSNVVVAVIDTGVDYNHPDLAANMWTNPGETPGDGIDNDGNGYTDDVYGINSITGSGDPWDDHSHGTHCSGTIGGVGNNGIGVAGVCWNVKIMALKFLSSGGSGSSSDAITCIQYAIDKGAHIMSNSWGGGGYSQALYDAIEAAKNAGILFVAAAGNSGVNTDSSPHYPSSYTNANVLSVAATDHNDQLASFSNYGAVSVDVAAPGVAVYSTVPNNSYASYSGTSMATPHVAGLAALIKSTNPALDWSGLKAQILDTADPLAVLDGKVLTGGRINAYNAVTNNPPPVVTITSPQNNSFVSGNVTIEATTADDANASKVEFYIDGVLSSTDVNAPWQFSWDTTAAADALHQVKAVVVDQQARTNEHVITVTVNNSGTPGVMFVLPLDGAGQVRGVVDIKVNADYAPGIAKVAFYIDDTLLTEVAAAPYETTWNSIDLPNGAHVIKAVAHGSDANTGEAQVTVTTDNIIIPQSERNALIALYNSTNGDTWYDNTNWKKPGGGFNDVGTEHIWYGVYVENNHVTYIYLPWNDLSGTLPPEIGDFPELIDLVLWWNYIGGTLPPEIGNLTKVEYLDLEWNEFTGAIPPEIGNMSAMWMLWLSYNNWEGSLPKELGNLTNMEYLLMYSASLTGSIPVEFGNLTKMIYLWLDDNALTGPIPKELGNLTLMQELTLYWNQLSGTIPPELGNLTNLTYLDFEDNNITGPIPPELGNLTNLETLWVSSNPLSGPIPAELGNLAGLKRIFVAFSSNTGTVPSSFGNLSNLEVLYLRSAGFVGELPSSLTQLTALASFNGKYNGFFTNDDTLRTFLNARLANWEATQTVAPVNVSAAAVSGTDVQVSWQPITFTAYTGGYNVYYSTTPGGPYTLSGTTADKTVSTWTVTGLTTGAPYYFVVQTKTDPNENNDNTLESTYSAEVSATPEVPLTITVLSPNGGENWRIDSDQFITWDSTGAVGDVKIEYSTDNGASWTTIAASTANDGSHPWDIPATLSDLCLVRVQESDGDPSDVSNGVFTISPPPPSCGGNWGVLNRPGHHIDAAFGGGTYVTVGADGAIFSSSDGVTWTQRSPGTSKHLFRVVYGNSRFVAVGASGTILTSTGGTSWTSADSGTGTALRGVGFGNNTYIAAGYNGTIVSSSDGLNWSKLNSGTTEKLQGISFGNNTFVAVGNGGIIFRSTNGTTWTQQTSAVSTDLYDITFGNNVFTAVGKYGEVVTSPGGVTWTRGSSGIGNSLYSVAFGNYQFTAAGARGKILVSSDGVNWDDKTSGTSAALTGICYSGSGFVATGVDVIVYSLCGAPAAALTLTSPNGGENLESSANHTITWTGAGIVGDVKLEYSIDDGATWVNITTGTVNDGGYDWTVPGDISDSCLLKISDIDGQPSDVSDAVFSIATPVAAPVPPPCGDSWNTAAVTGTHSDATYGNSLFVSVGYGGAVFTSANGSNWTGQTSGTGNNLYGVAYGNSTFVAVGASGTIITSGDGASWTTRTSPKSNAFLGATFGNSTFVATGYRGTIITSSNGSTWTARGSGVSGHLQEVAYGNGLFVAVGNNGVIVTSPDGITWTSRTSPVTSNLNSVAYGLSMFAAAGKYGEIITSEDGITWTRRVSGTGSQFYEIIYGDNTFVAVGASGKILTSGDGINWYGQTSGANAALLGAGFGDGVFIAVGIDTIQYSSCGPEPPPAPTPTITVTAPNGGETWETGSSQTISWTSEGAVDTVKIEYSTDSGATWTSVVSATADTGTYSWTVPDDASAACKVKVSDTGGTPSDASDGVFTIEASPAPAPPPPCGDSWTNTAVTGSHRASAYGNSTFVAVGASGIVFTSADGAAWTAQTSGTGNHLYSIAYGTPGFTAVGAAGIIITSTNGTSWTTRTASTSATLRGITFADSKYVAVGYYGKILTSPDGAAWTIRTSGTSEKLQAVTHGNNMFIAVGNNGMILTSSNGTSWTKRTSPVASHLNGVVYADSVFVAVGQSGQVITSPNGIDWTKRTSGTASSLYAAAYGNSSIVAVGGGGTILTSGDGATWTAQTPAPSALLGITYGNSRFIALGGGFILSSTCGAAPPEPTPPVCGENWTSVSVTGGHNAVTYGGSTYVAVANSGSIVTSSDAANWTPRTSNTSNHLYDVVYGNSLFVVVGRNGTILTSSNGTTWTARTSGTAAALRAVTYGNSLYIAVGYYGNIFTSPNGIDWTSRSSGTGEKLQGIAYGKSTYVVTGNTGTILTSANGTNWTAQSSPTANNINDVTFGNSTFAAVANGGVIITSSNGGAWTKRTSGTSSTFYSVVFGESTFAASGASGTIVTSSDAISWTKQTSGSSAYLVGAGYGNSVFLAVGSGTILYSQCSSADTSSGSSFQPDGYRDGSFHGEPGGGFPEGGEPAPAENTVPAIQLLSPNGGETLKAGEYVSIAWQADKEIEDVKLEYSPDNGSTFLPITGRAPNTGQFNWQAPHHISSNCLVRIGSADAPEDHLTNLLYEVTFKTGQGGFMLWLGDAANPALKPFIPRISLGMGSISFNEMVKEIPASSLSANTPHRLKVLLNREKETASIWLDDVIISEDLPLNEGFTFSPAVAISSASAGADGIELEEVKVSLEDTAFTLFSEDFERFEEGGFPQDAGWLVQSVHHPDAAAYILHDTVQGTKTLKLQATGEQPVILIKYFDLSAALPFDISDRPFNIE
jgi:subtilisin family serine protease